MAKLGDSFFLGKEKVREMIQLDMNNDTLAEAGSNITRPDNPFSSLDRSIDQYVTLVIFLIGFPGNILCFLIWIQKRMRHSSGVYLAALAFTDLIFLCLLVIYELEIAWGIQSIRYPVWCSVFPMLHLAAQYLSPLLVLGFTTERYISICHPFKRERFCTVRRAKIVITGLVILTFAFGSVHAYFFQLQELTTDNTTMCSPRKEVVQGGTKSIFSIYSTVVDLLCFLVGNIAVLVLNVLVIFEMRRLSRVEQTVLQGNSLQKKSATTVMLLSVSFYQIITTMPISIAYALYMEYDIESSVAEYGVYSAHMRSYTYRHVLTFIKEYGVTHYAFNIFIYIITGKMFRSELKRLLLWSVGKKSLPPHSDYSTLRSSVRTTTTTVKTTKTWVHVNGDGSDKQPKPLVKKDATGETLL